VEASTSRYRDCRSHVHMIIASQVHVVDAASLASALGVSRKRLYSIWDTTSLGRSFKHPKLLVDWIHLIRIGTARQLSASWKEVAEGTNLGTRTLWRLFRRYLAKLNGYFSAE
jgi:transcriptional regulator GlxA family with amidase domain